MVTARFASIALLLVGLVVTCASAAREEKKGDSNREKLIGVWEAFKTVDLPPKSTLEFTRDNKVKLTIPVEKDKEKPVVFPGTYVVEGSKLKVSMPGADGKEMKQTLKIVELTELKLVTRDEKGAIDEFKKVVPSEK